MTLYTDDDVTKAGQAMHDAWFEPGEGWDRADAESGVRAILDAVAPAIAARALRDFAELTRGPSKDLRDAGTCLSIALDAEERADEIEETP